VALKEAVLAFEPGNNKQVRVFDRGITARKTYDEFIEKNIPFVSRINVKCKRKLFSANSIQQPIETETLFIHNDSWVYLFTEKARAEHPIRYIEATRKESGESISFVTNIKDLRASEIAMLYKHRWDIEVFFKFMKQELNFGHLINRSENGIKIMLYCTLISAILLLVYKELNRLKGYKIMKQKFIDNLERALLEDFVLICGGKPELVELYLKSPPS
jgi:IS4 transposase